jgi:ZIP family zinc transporter/zinc and cadmium transporter
MNDSMGTRALFVGMLGLGAALANVLGAYILVRGNWSRLYLKYCLALSAGFMLATAFVEIVPESMRISGDGAMLLVLIGYFLVHLFEHTLAPHFHFGEETHHDALVHRHAGLTALLGLIIHTFFDGVAIAAGFLVSGWLGGVIFVAIVLHKVPEGFTVASLMLASGQSRRVALFASVALGAATLAGVLLTNVLRSQVGYALPLSAGVTIYVAASDLMPEVNREPGAGMAVVVFLGAAILLCLHYWLHV